MANNFADFELGRDNPYELAGNLLPEMAVIFDFPDVSLDTTPNSEALSRLIGVLGENKVLHKNIPAVQERLGKLGVKSDGIDGITIAAGWLERSGVQQALDRSLWTPDAITPPEAPIVISGGVANWQDRTARLLVNRANADRNSSRTVLYPVGTRIMDGVTDVTNINVIDYRNTHKGQLPSETDYAWDFIRPQLEAVGYSVDIMAFDTQKGPEVARAFVENRDHLFRGSLTFARVANAGILFAGEVRKAARELRPNLRFDSDSDSPQVFILTDSFPVAKNDAELAIPTTHQHPYTGIRQIAVTAKVMVEALE